MNDIYSITPIDFFLIGIFSSKSFLLTSNIDFNAKKKRNNRHKNLLENS
jgi:hypothetical protein